MKIEKIIIHFSYISHKYKLDFYNLNSRKGGKAMVYKNLQKYSNEQNEYALYNIDKLKTLS